MFKNLLAGLRKVKEIRPVNRPMVGFSTHGCQAQIHEFMFAGIVVGRKDTDQTQYYPNLFMYRVKITKSNEVRYDEGIVRDIPSWYCTEKDGILFFYD